MDRLKELRKANKKTQQEVADFMGITRRGYQKWENGESQIKPDKAQALADYFGVSVGFLLGFGTIEEELQQSRKETLERFQKEDDALLSLGYLLSDNQIQNILDLIYSFSSSNNTYIRSLIEHDDKNIKDILENDFFCFTEVYPEFLENKIQEYEQYKKDCTDPIRQKQIQERLSLIADYEE